MLPGHLPRVIYHQVYSYTKIKRACCRARRWGAHGGLIIAGSYLRLIDFVYHSTLGLRVIKKRRRRMQFLNKIQPH